MRIRLPQMQAVCRAALRLLAVTFPLLALAGAARNFSMVPFWDMWHAYLGFYAQVTAGDVAPWWSLHNEHRIVLARLLFWLDLHFFRGTVVFLIAMNFVLMAAAFLTFRAIARERAAAGGEAPTARTPLAAITLFVLACVFSWTQKENIVWGFQSQFFLAQWLPLLALFWMARAAVPGPASTRYFAGACALGVLALGSMASGVLALPLLLAYAAWMRMGWRRVLVLAALTGVLLPLYFHGYSTPREHGSLRNILQYEPLVLLQYVLVYLGSPFFHLGGERSVLLAKAAGFAFFMLALVAAVRSLRRSLQPALEFALLAYLLYIAGTAFGTGVGRLVLGLQQATASRYTTPAIMAWLALLMLYVPAITGLRSRVRLLALPALGLVAWMFAQQLHALDSSRALLFEKQIAALALAMDIQDDPQVRTVYFNAIDARREAQHARAAGLSVFGDPLMATGIGIIGQRAADPPAARCIARIAEVNRIPGDRRFRRIHGWIAPVHGSNDIDAVRMTAQGRVVGYALAGERISLTLPGRTHVRVRVFKGYVEAGSAEAALELVASGSPCAVRIGPPPRPPFAITPLEEGPPMINLPPSAIVRNRGWTGADSERTQVAGFLVVGSHVPEAGATGAVTLALRRGDSLYFRSGTEMGRQLFHVDDGKRFSGTLPRTDRWSAMAFDHPDLPDSFTLTLTDDGSGPDEWSAIGVLDRVQRQGQ